MENTTINTITTALWSFTIGFGIAGFMYGLNGGTNDKNDEQDIVFVWNDDEESIPIDGSLITLEFTDENTVYIGPYDERAAK